MGTRGCYGFRKNGIDKLTYNHFDSYPDGLGETMVEFCKETSIAEMRKIFDRIILIREDSKPTSKQIEECIAYYDGNVSEQRPEDWYCLLRDAQGNPDAYKAGLNYMINNNDFIKDSLFCEYAYIINLDEECLEFYIGFQKTPCEDNRYGTESEDNYYPCKLVAEFGLGAINECAAKDIVKAMNKAVDAEYDDDTDEADEEDRDVTVDDFDDIADAIRNCSTTGTLDNGIGWRIEFDY